ncbi:dihydropteroate synthase [Sporichthya brevicatena]|uniref:Dihydropteroate synthase n=2 Tax=Sporichthya brevicatena TaxID=171442 RepID=A0ABN1GWE0_9ACTN
MNRAVPGLPVRDRCLVMGVVNVTPDSFSDGGEFFDAETAVQRGRYLMRTGADLIDVGGESTRPGAVRIEAAEELRRVIPVVAALANDGIPVAVDTTRAEVAADALAAGARLVNDVSGGLSDPEMVGLVAAAGVPYVLMHWRGPSVDMQSRAVYDDVVADVCRELQTRLDEVTAAGVDPEHVILDPGLGFAKTAEHNWALLARLHELHALGRPLLVAASRKAFLGRLLPDADGHPRPVDQREDATTAVSALAAAQGAYCVRVHEAGPTADAVRVAAAWTGAR